MKFWTYRILPKYRRYLWWAQSIVDQNPLLVESLKHKNFHRTHVEPGNPTSATRGDCDASRCGFDFQIRVDHFLRTFTFYLCVPYRTFCLTIYTRLSVFHPFFSDYISQKLLRSHHFPASIPTISFDLTSSLSHIPTVHVKGNEIAFFETRF